MIEDCKAHGAFDPVTMGRVPNVGLMAQKPPRNTARTTRRSRSRRTVWFASSTTPARCCWSRPVETGDIFRMCQTKDAPIQDWVKLAVNRARATNTPAVFWLDAAARARRADHQEGRAVPEGPRHRGLDIRILTPVEATKFSLERIRKGRGHDFGHRQRAARLPDRPVPDHGTGHRAPRCCRSSR